MRPCLPLVAILALASHGSALTLNPGDSFPAVPTTDPTALPALDGPIVADRAIPFLIFVNGTSTGHSGVFNNWVVRESASGNLDFYYQFTIDPGDPIPNAPLPPGPFGDSLGLMPIILTGYRPFTTDLYSRADLGGILPVFPGRSADGDTVRLSYGSANPTYNFGPGGYSQFFIRTNATAFTSTNATELDFIFPDPLSVDPIRASTFVFPTFTPAVPEPLSLLTLPLALLAMLLVRRR